MTEIRFYNTLTHQLETFEPADPSRLRMYSCGPTVYDYAHIGNFRAFVFADVVRRFLELVYGPGQVRHAMNLTDVGHMTEDQLADGAGEDKMQVAARRIKQAKKQGTLPPDAVNNPDDPYQVAQFYIDAFEDDARALGIKVVDDDARYRPRATQHIDDMQHMIRKLIEQGFAYATDDGAVYFDVGKFPEYGKLSGNTLDQLRGGAGGRVRDEHQQAKRHPADFLLWKRDPSHLMKWDSPWGEGHPGWHIECSAMAMSVLETDTIDIHTGGEDNIFPHHECEIAQSCCYSGQPRFANVWLHTRFLLVDGQKMSKRLGNFITVRQLRDQDVDPAAIRFELMRAHYRSNANFTRKGLDDSAKAVGKLRDAASQWRKQCDNQPAEVGQDHPAVSAFLDALADDLNVAGAIGEVFKFIDNPPADSAEALGVLNQVDQVLAVTKPASSGSTQDDKIVVQLRELLPQHHAARMSKDFARADQLRQQMIDRGATVNVLPGNKGTSAETTSTIVTFTESDGLTVRLRGQ